jgi:hypothetical protein
MAASWDSHPVTMSAVASLASASFCNSSVAAVSAGSLELRSLEA